jgi:tetratricopeptide (TPR) repeat protein
MDQPNLSQSGTIERPPLDTNAAKRSVPQWLMLLAVVLLTFAAYAPTLRYQFVHDDQAQIVANPSIQSWRHLPQYFTQQVWAGYYPGMSGNYYRPAFLIWLRLNDMLFGLHPWGWHLTTVILHLLTTLLVYFLALRLARDPFTAAVAALLFGLHPVHIEAVTWISGLTEPLLAVFFILAFLCYLRAREADEHRGRWLALSLLLFVVAMLEKETGVIFPLLIVAYEWFCAKPDAEHSTARRMARQAASALRPALPYFALIAFYLAARIYALKGFSHPLTPMPISSVLLTVPSLLVFWVSHFFWPVGLSTFYDMHPVVHPTLLNFALPAIAVLLVACLGIAAARQSRATSFALAWIILPLLPPLDIRVFLKNDFAHDRYLYLPSVGLAVLLALALRHLPARKQVRGIPVSQAALILLLTPVMMLGVMREGSYFASPRTFYAHCARTAPGNALAVTDYAADLGEQGRYSEALRFLQGLVNREPTFGYGVYNLAYTYYRMGQMESAEEYFRRSIQLQPDNPNAYLYLGLIELRSGRIKDAEESIRRSLQVDPRNYGSHFALGVILKGRGDLAGAQREFEAELANYPDEVAAKRQIAEIRTAQRK